MSWKGATQEFFLINWLNRHKTIRLEKCPIQSSLLTSKSILGRNPRLSGSQFSASLVKRHCRKYKIIESLHSRTIIKRTSKGERTLLSSLLSSPKQIHAALKSHDEQGINYDGTTVKITNVQSTGLHIGHRPDSMSQPAPLNLLRWCPWFSQIQELLPLRTHCIQR